MSAELTQINTELRNHRATLQSVLGAVKSAASADHVQDLRARLEAAKGWAKTYKQTKHLRLDFLRVEVEALIRLYQLGGKSYLTPSEWEAAEYLAQCSDAQLNEMYTSVSSATTAAGFVRSWRTNKANAAKFRHETKEWAARFSTDAPYPEYRETELQQVRRQYGWYNMRAALVDLLEEATETDQPFTVDDVVTAITDTPGLRDGISSDPAIREGLAEVARKAIRSAPPELWGETVIPRYITTFLENDGATLFARVPVMAAKVGDVEQMVKLREEQLKQDQNALAKLQDFLSKLRATGATDSANIGAILVKEVEQDAA